MRNPWLGDRVRLPADLADQLVDRAARRGPLHRARLQFLQLFSVGGVPGIRHERGQPDPYSARRGYGPDHAMVGAAGRDSGPRVELRFEPAVFDLCKIRILAEQPGPDSHQARRDFAGAALRIPMDALRIVQWMESGAADWNYVAAGVLGSHRAGLRPVALFLERKPGCSGDGPGRGCCDCADGNALMAAHEFGPL